MLEVRVLGPMEIVRDGATVPIGSTTQRLVLTVLAAERGVVSRDRLVEAIWAGRPPRTAEASLAAYVSRLRRALGSGRIERRPSGYVLRADWWDTDVFETLVRETVTDEPGSEAARLEEALGLWRGSAFGSSPTIPRC
ncbi:winged helix-turn-helix domain-containing protein [Pseudonocardia sp. H11422]|uniref:AfsR/SARP family transcriptional regulator n=1 Tax=Pseudonocardia sp. H11422 TaxID=2835866 RepID=UPI001BDC7ABE|nr:winged helix-turn-helix domain-containing protein [Pseudonocardia sp. H11422]